MKVIYLFFLTTFFVITGQSFGRDLILLGFNGQNTPAVGKTYDRLLREKLSVTPDIQLVDYVQCQRYKKMIRFEDYPVVAGESIESLAKYVKDTTYFVWGTVEELKITPDRRWFFQARIKGDLRITLNMYSLSERQFAYAGTIRSIIYENKGVVFFTPISKAVHVSVLEQTDILEQLEFEAVKKSSQMISATIRSETARNGQNIDVNKKDEQSVKEVFKTPSVEAPIAKKDTLVNDTTGKAAQVSAPDSGKGNTKPVQSNQ